MRQVFKYILPIEDYCAQSMPEGAEILHVGNQDERLCVWALVDASRPHKMREFRIAGTGHPIRDEGIRYHGSAQFAGGDLVFHVFERVA